jgi:hypothetical protein
MTRPHATRVLYEPMVIWDQARIRPSTAGQFALTMDPKRFYNGTQFPFVAQYVIISPVGYTLQRYLSPPTASEATYHNAMSALLAGVSVRITAPGRKHLSRRTVEVGGYRPRPVGIAKPSLPFASSLLGLSRWDFQFPNDEGMVLPRLSSMQLDVSGYTFPNVGIATPSAGDDLVSAHLAWYERSDSFWGGAARYSGLLPIQPKVPLSGQPSDQFWPATPNVVPSDGYGFGLGNQAARQTNLSFDAAGNWNHKRFMVEESNVGTDWNRFCGFGVALDQIDLDQRMQTSVTAGVAGAPLAPLSQRTALRGKCLAGGTGQEFFFPDACPVSLCCPTINEAGIVHNFDDPISLDPNAGLSIDIETPGAFIPGAEQSYSGIYNIGVSLVGYRIVEQG